MIYVIAVIGGLVLSVYVVVGFAFARALLEERREREREWVEECRPMREALAVAARAWGE